MQVTPKFGCDRFFLVFFFPFQIGRVAPLFSGEDTVQGKEEVKKKRVVTFGQSVGRLVWSRQDRQDVDVWTCGRVVDGRGDGGTWREGNLGRKGCIWW